MKTEKAFKLKRYLLLFSLAICTLISVVIVGRFVIEEVETVNTPVPNKEQSIQIESQTDSSSFEHIDVSTQNSEDNTSIVEEVIDNIVIEPVKLGHFPYKEAKEQNLVVIASYAQGKYQRYERLHKDAALALMRMIYAARDSGVWIVPVSGYRDIEKQGYLFKAQVRRRGTEMEAAKLSAPPGHSEHHTGFTIDLTDGLYLNQDITYKFASSDAYKWLVAHAYKFGFELSFPENNSQGVSFEPWHWRYIGSSDALKTFARARENQ